MTVDEGDKKFYREFFVGLNYKYDVASFFFLGYMIRRTIIVFVCLFFNSMPLFQVFTLLYLSLFQGCYLVGVKPQKDAVIARNEIINEMIVYSAAFHAILLLIVPEERQSLVGWSLIAFIMTNILASMFVLFRDCCRYTYASSKAKYSEFKQKLERWDREASCPCKCENCGSQKKEEKELDKPKDLKLVLFSASSESLVAYRS